MATELREIYDLALQQITDYRLIDLFNTSQDDFETYMQAFLEFAIVEFSGVCSQSLSYSDSTKVFGVTLTTENKVMLATLIVKYWLKKTVNDITQMNLHVTDRDFRIASEAQNLREKVAYLNVVKEECSQALQSYAYKNVDWTSWIAQDYDGL